MIPNPNVMVSVGSIDFTGREEMYEALKDADLYYEEDEKIEKHNKYLYFDKDNPIVWVCWYEGVV